MTRTRQNGFSLIELLIVVAIIGIVSTIAVPQLMDAIDRGRQRRTMADMRSLSTANGTYRVDAGLYAETLAALSPNYMIEIPGGDGWGNEWLYASLGARGYAIDSLGADGLEGPAPPEPWINDPYDPDLRLVSGAFTQAPTGQ